jgi:DNA processing protein
MPDPRFFWVAFSLVNGIGAVRFENLLKHFGDVQVAWEASPKELKAAGLNEKIVDNLLQVRASVDLNLVWDDFEKLGVRVLTLLDEEYPRRLKEIGQAPPVLYVRGALLPEDEWAIAVVGTRRFSPYGQQVTEELGRFLAANGITVVSGLARGIDGIAHEAALAAGGRTIAVLGSGIDRIYPPEHRRLAEEITASGALISDYALDTPPEPTNFPPRNRIISGLSIATIVVEAGKSSGALITANFAADQGREVFALPGSIYAKQSEGTNRLIRSGAQPLLAFEDLLEMLDLRFISDHKTARAVLPANAVEAKLIEVLSQEPLHIDEISSKAGLPIAHISASLSLMELKGMVRQVGGMSYVAVREVKANYQVDHDS